MGIGRPAGNAGLLLRSGHRPATVCRRAPGSIIIFATTVRPVGLVIATFVSFVVSGAGSTETRWVETIIAGVVMTGFSVLLFVYLLNLPFQLWPRF